MDFLCGGDAQWERPDTDCFQQPTIYLNTVHPIFAVRDGWRIRKYEHNGNWQGESARITEGKCNVQRRYSSISEAFDNAHVLISILSTNDKSIHTSCQCGWTLCRPPVDSIHNLILNNENIHRCVVYIVKILKRLVFRLVFRILYCESIFLFSVSITIVFLKIIMSNFYKFILDIFCMIVQIIMITWDDDY